MNIPSDQFTRTPVISLESSQASRRVGSAPNSPMSNRHNRHKLDISSCGDKTYVQCSLESCMNIQESQMMTSSLTNLPPNGDEYNTSDAELDTKKGGNRPSATDSNGPVSLPTPEFAEQNSVSAGISYLSR